MTAKLTASADGSKVLIGTAAENALEIDANAKTIKALSPYTLAGNGPAFRAYASIGTSCPADVPTKIGFQTEDFDIGDCYNPTTGEFNPKVAGYYRVEALVTMNDLTTSNVYQLVLSKNGSVVQDGTPANGGSNVYAASPVSALIYMNGTTDVVTISMFQSTGSSKDTVIGSRRTSFSAFLARAA